MKFMLLVYNDPALVDAMPASQFDSQQLEPVRTARSVRVRNGKLAITDGPFAETKEILGGFNIIEAENMDEAVRIASEFPWIKTGCIEVRPVRDISAVAAKVGAARAAAP